MIFISESITCTGKRDGPYENQNGFVLELMAHKNHSLGNLFYKVLIQININI